MAKFRTRFFKELFFVLMINLLFVKHFYQKWTLESGMQWLNKCHVLYAGDLENEVTG